MKILKKINSLIVLLFALLPICATAEISLGDVANNLLEPTAFLTRFVIFGCYVVGVGFLLAAIMQYRIHVQTPKLVPLTTPVLLLFLAIVLLIMPYATTHSGTSWSAVEIQKREGGGAQAVGPKLPDIGRPGMVKGSSGTSSTAPSAEPSPLPMAPQSSPVAPQNGTGSGSGSGHWSDSPEYR
jgi:hypothetical protein